jgi:hypothetical protein
MRHAAAASHRMCCIYSMHTAKALYDAVLQEADLPVGCGCCCRSMSSVSINSEDCSATPRAPAGQQMEVTQAAGSSVSCTPPALQQQQAGVSTMPAPCGKGASRFGGSMGLKHQAELAACQVQLGSQFEAVHDYLVRVHRGGWWYEFGVSASNRFCSST